MGIQITRTGNILGMSEPIFFPELIFLNCSFEILWIIEKKMKQPTYWQQMSRNRIPKSLHKSYYLNIMTIHIVTVRI